MTDPTIYALSSAAGRAGVAVIRVSGPAAGAVVQALCRTGLPKPRVLTLATLWRSAHFSDRSGDESVGNRLESESSLAESGVDCGYVAAESGFDGGGEVIDRACVIWCPAPRSFTGDDVAEFQVHGGRAVIDATLQAIGLVPGTTPAEPGAFTRRAFENNRMDLTEAEGLIDLIDAETEAQRRQSLRQMGGALGGLYEGWRTRMVSALALIAAEIDFSDEDLPDTLLDQARASLTVLTREMTDHLNDNRRGERLRDGLRVAIIGAPNVGKSTVLNWLAGRDAAIVSPVAGTTRDVIEVHLDIGGYPVTFADTAGLRETDDFIEQEGVRRARAWADQADFRLMVYDATEKTESVVSPSATDILIFNKADLVDRTEESQPGHWVSAKIGDGMTGALADVKQRLQAAYQVSDVPVMTRERHRLAVTDSKAALERALAAVDIDLMAEDVRLASNNLGRITGRVDVEDILDVVFRDFCIGK